MELDSLHKLFVMELKDLHSAEKQLLKALPKMAKVAFAPELRDAFREHLEQTRGQVERLDQIFEKIGATSRGKKCVAMEGLIEEGQELMEQKGEPAVRDAGLIAAAQRIEHYEIAGYGCARTYANVLGDREAARLLQQTLEEESQTDKKLTQLAETLINLEAAESSAGQAPTSSRSAKGGRTRRASAR